MAKMDFNDIDYQRIIGDILNDMLYVNSSKRGKINSIRSYSEVLVRKILNINKSDKFSLGQVEYEKSYKEKGKKLLGDEGYQNLIKVINKIRPLGNDAAHTQRLEEFSEKDLSDATEALFDLIAFLFISFFEKHPINENIPHYVLYNFSLLPPIIRYKTLFYSFEKNKNAIIANKLSLAVVKAFDKEYALKWLEEHKQNFTSIIFNGTNSYEVALTDINLLGENISKNGKVYETFEEAKKVFLKNKVDNESQVVKELNSLIDFVYIGRKEARSL